MSSSVFATYAQLLKALAHPERLEIIYLLQDRELCVGEIYSMLDLPQAKVSQQLMILRQHHLVSSHKVGKSICYKLSHPNIFKACTLLRDFLIATHGADAEVGKLKHDLDQVLATNTDPVCGMQVASRHAHHQTYHQGKYYYFCASGCLKKFQAEPAAYLPTKEA